MSWWLAMPFVLLIGATLLVAGANIFGGSKIQEDSTQRDHARLLLLSAIPLGFIASSLDCMGLALEGCSSFCTFIKLVWIPLVAAACAVYFFTRRQGWVTAICLMAFVPLFPHCVCYNVGNAWWIDRLGASPVCYVWGFAVSIIAVGALVRGGRHSVSLLMCSAIIAGAAAFFVSHHYFHFPW